ncbi:hypothetical protein ACIBKZ_16155 [Streptomyces sp. NPDC050421]
MSLNTLRSLARRVVPTLLVAQVALLPLQPTTASAASCEVLQSA